MRRRIVFFAAAFLFAMVALLPLRFAVDAFGLPGRGLAAREAAGSVWLGALGEAQLGGLAVGDTTARLRMLPLVAGRARMDLDGAGARPFRAGITVTRHGFGIDDATASLDPAGAFGGLPVAAIDLSDVSVFYSAGLCRRAEGLVTARVALDLPGVAAPDGLSGEARCESGALLLPLSSRSGAERLALRLFEDGRWRAELSAGTFSQRLEGAF